MAFIQTAARALVFLIALITSLAYSQPSPSHQLQQYSDQHTQRRTFQHDDLELMDVVLLATIDGKFHALNRTTGRMLWSMEQPVANPQVAVSQLSELVQTEHLGLLGGAPIPSDDSENEDDEDRQVETYIIEPQSGRIFVKPVSPSPSPNPTLHDESTCGSL